MLICFFCVLPEIVEASSSQNGRELLSLQTVSERLGMQYIRLEGGEKALLKSQWSQLLFQARKRDFLFNGLKVYLGSPVIEQETGFHISKIDYERTLAPILTPQIYKHIPKLYHIILDPGHGGKDTGARNKGRNLKEKSLALDLAMRLESLLRKRGYKISLTRREDKFIELEERSALANRLQADLFVSLHFNAVASGHAHGIETYAYTPQHQYSTSRDKLSPGDAEHKPANRNDPWNILLGYHVQKAMIQSLRSTDRGLKRARFTVLESLRCPGILVEGGFLSHSAEAAKVESPGYREQIARAIAAGIYRYQKSLNRLRAN